MVSKPIYLDYQATTPIAPEVLQAMAPYWQKKFGNPSSNSHSYGWEAADGVKKARGQIAEAIGAKPDEIIFTSGATEANNLAIKGIAETQMAKGKHIVTMVTEHQAVLGPCRYLEKFGFEVTYLPVEPNGTINLDLFEQSLRSDTILVSVMAANNEIGVLQPLEVIGQICHDRGIVFHTDAAQAIGKICLDVNQSKIDLMAITGHKIYGPKGIGALFVRGHNHEIKLAPQIHGGGQEQGLRSGTLNPPLIVGLSKAIELALENLHGEQNRLKALRNQLWQKLNTLDGIILNGDEKARLAGNLNVTVLGVDGNKLFSTLRSRVAVSSGSACSNGKPSHVLKALGHSPRLAQASLRFSCGRPTTAAEVEEAGDYVVQIIQKLRKGNAISLIS